MPHTCTKCSRVNPDDALFCYFDGQHLPANGKGGSGKAGAAAAAPPVPASLQGFSQPLVFPNGEQCRNFDQLAVACQKNWQAALDLIKSGGMEKFLGGIGRADLAMAARQAAQFPDKDRGLDQFLARLPSKAIQEPKLAVDPAELSMNLVAGTDKQFEIKLKNQGMRLLYGSITVDNCPWITLGKAPGAAQKLFQFGSDLKIPVNIRGKYLKATNKPLEGRLVVESNGGSFDIPVKAEVPIKPFPDGVLAGARSPRQVAEKAKTNPKEAAALFEKGDVARWYKLNGWTYPVKGPAASGLGAVQQFFEALGLTPPPKVGIETKRIDMVGEPGASQKAQFEIKSEEKRPVYAHAVADQPWLEVGRAVLNGRVATIPLRVNKVPDRQGETLSARVLVTANGNQKFIIPVQLKIGTGLNFRPKGAAVIAGAYKPKGMSKVHLLPLLLLLLCLFLIFIWDIWKNEKPDDRIFVEGKPDAGLTAEEPPKIEPLDYINRVHVQFSDQQRFGLVCPKLRDPRNGDKPKLLTRDERGITNNTCVRIEGYEYIYGVEIPGVRYVKEKGKLMKEVPIPGKDKDRAWMSVWESEFGRVRVTQSVEIVIGEQTRLFDTALIRYQIWNRDKTPHTVGLRVMLDTFIGSNDGVPFYIPSVTSPDGREMKGAHLVDKMETFPQKDIPDFVQALETGNLEDKDATVAVVGLKIKGAEPIEKMVICRWPQNSEARWGGTGAPGDWVYEPMDKNPNAKDSAVILYWQQTNMKPDEKRNLAFTYGLGRIISLNDPNSDVKVAQGGKMRLFVGRASLTKPFVATAYVKASDPNQQVTLRLPKGLEFVPGEKDTKSVPAPGPAGYSQVTWRLKAKETGSFVIEADAPTIGIATEKVTINKDSLFDG
jgi:hypothetical protein